MILRVFLKLFVKEFYRENAFFFLVGMGLAFGFMGEAEHKALAAFFISSNLIICIPLFLWLLYAMKIIHFNHQFLYRSENRFLHQAIHFPQHLLFPSLLIVLLAQFAPIILYAVFLLMTCFQNNYFITVPAISGTILLVLLAGLAKLTTDLKNPWYELQSTRVKIWLDKRIVRSFPHMIIEYVIRNHFLSWLGSKIFSMLLLYGAIALYKSDTYDYRLLAMVATIAFTANIVLLNHIHRFENRIFLINKNMPIPIYKRVGTILMTFLVFFIPELGLLLTGMPAMNPFYLLIIPYVISILIFLYGFLFTSDWELDQTVRIIFFFTMGLIVLILFHVPLLLVTLLLVSTGLYCWKKWYYKFEITADNQNLRGSKLSG